MESLSGRAKVVVKKEMTFAERIYLPAILGGALITLRHLFKRKSTVKYPEKKARVQRRMAWTARVEAR